MAKKGLNRIIIMMKSTESHHVYSSTKNKANTSGRLELRKYDPVVRRTVVYREGK
jgi:large subunit ribosomal protein L33